MCPKAAWFRAQNSVNRSVAASTQASAFPWRALESGARPLSVTALLSGRDRPRCLCVLRLSNYDSLLAGVTMTLFCTHGRVSGPSSLLDLEVMAPPRIQCPMLILTSGPETWSWGPVGWRRSSHDRVSRVPACESSPRAKLESDRY